MARRIKTVEQLVDLFGGQTLMAEALSNVKGMKKKITQSTCQNWVGRDAIPRGFMYPIYLAAKDLKIEIAVIELLQLDARSAMSERVIFKQRS